MNLHTKLHEVFTRLYGKPAISVRSPGRVNLIGEHTDYNQGLVLPAAINKNIWLIVSPRNDSEIHLHSMDYGQNHQGNIHQLERSTLLWPDYILGVVSRLGMRGLEVKGFNLTFTGDIPLGGGLSSSAALECATAFALNELYSLGLTRMDMALISQAAENEFVGVKVGLMDMFASMFGKKGSLIKLDCRSNDYQYIPFLAKDISIVLFDTQVKHSLASSAYNERRSQCEEGVKLIARHNPGVTSLRDATLEMLINFVKPHNELVFKRCKYVVEEILRLEAGVLDIERNDFAAFGRRMYETHDGLQHLYEVSAPELDILVDLVRDETGVIGARMMGGGFGGCTINLVKKEDVESLTRKVSSGYFESLGMEPKTYVVDIEDGTSLL